MHADRICIDLAAHHALHEVDFHNSYVTVSGKNTVPLGLPNIAYLAAMKLLQTAPMLLTVLSVEQLLDRMLKVIFDAWHSVQRKATREFPVHLRAREAL